MKTRKLKDLKENECIEVKTIKEAKYLSKKLRFGHHSKIVSPEKILSYGFILLDNGVYFHTAGTQKRIPSSDFIKPKRNNKLKAKVSKIEKEQEYIRDILANMNRLPLIGGKIEIVKFPEDVKQDVSKTEITELPDRWCVEDNWIVSKWASDKFGCDKVVHNDYLHIEMDGNTFGNYAFEKLPRKGYTLISKSDFERLVLNKPKDLEAGKWYKLNSDLVCYQKTDTGYGFVNNVYWNDTVFMSGELKWELATNEEVEAALIAEAKKRYPIGCKIKTASGGKYEVALSSHEGFILNKDMNGLYITEPKFIYVFCDGKWAEIIQEKEIEYVETYRKCLDIINNSESSIKFVSGSFDTPDVIKKQAIESLKIALKND